MTARSEKTNLQRCPNNCYSYACNRPYLPDGKPRPKGRPQPGGGSFALNCTSVLAAAKKDGLTDPDKAGVCPPGRHKVYLVIARGLDYHWYREDSDGMWSHKRGLTPCTNLDAPATRGALGKPITDPSTCNREYPDEDNYSIDCGTLCA